MSINFNRKTLKGGFLLLIVVFLPNDMNLDGSESSLQNNWHRKAASVFIYGISSMFKFQKLADGPCDELRTIVITDAHAFCFIL
jgi:hypothetical protein